MIFFQGACDVYMRLHLQGTLVHQTLSRFLHFLHTINIIYLLDGSKLKAVEKKNEARFKNSTRHLDCKSKDRDISTEIASYLYERQATFPSNTLLLTVKG